MSRLGKPVAPAARLAELVRATWNNKRLWGGRITTEALISTVVALGGGGATRDSIETAVRAHIAALPLCEQVPIAIADARPATELISLAERCERKARDESACSPDKLPLYAAAHRLRGWANYMVTGRLADEDAEAVRTAMLSSGLLRKVGSEQ